jgi:non-homologous end joining protein Ku
MERMRHALDVAEEGMKSQQAPDEKDFETRVSKIVKDLMEAKEGNKEVSELKQKFQEQEQELIDLKAKLAENEATLASEKERSARLEILAGAAETINKHKKGK